MLREGDTVKLVKGSKGHVEFRAHETAKVVSVIVDPSSRNMAWVRLYFPRLGKEFNFEAKHVNRLGDTHPRLFRWEKTIEVEVIRKAPVEIPHRVERLAENQEKEVAAKLAAVNGNWRSLVPGLG